jgi:hypothetical protein
VVAVAMGLKPELLGRCENHTFAKTIAATGFCLYQLLFLVLLFGLLVLMNLLFGFRSLRPQQRSPVSNTNVSI